MGTTLMKGKTMTTITSEKDLEALTMTMRATFDAGVPRVWQIWEDPRQLERWWGPPEWPATFVTHALEPGAMSHYYMTGPDGEKGHGWWKITDVDSPHHLGLDDGFADDEGNPTGELGAAHITVTLEPQGEQTRMTLLNTFASLEQLEQMLQMGMEEGMKLAMGQIEAILAE
jgi:uncharacterized protein YndB with AHSA1/START domain